MPPGSRIRANNVYGTITDNPLASGATTFNSGQLPLLPAVTGNHAVLTLDPLRQFGEPEIIIVTAHTALATVATITRGAYGTVARAHPQGTFWAHAPIDEDVTEIVTSSTRPTDPYEGQPIYETDTDSYKGYNGTTWEHALSLGAWTVYTPTLTQSITVSKTITEARYMRGPSRLIIVEFNLTATSAGTAGQNVLVGLPVAANGAVGTMVGPMLIYDANTTTRYHGDGELVSNITVGMGVSQASPSLFGASPAVTLANGDIIRGIFSYEAAS